MDPNSKTGAGATGQDGSFTAPDAGRTDRREAPGAGGTVLDTYTYALLDPRVGAADENLRLLGAGTLGIEVTVPELARGCGLGNIDPQHGGGAGIGTSGATAIEACLTATPPAAGATLVTVRPDLDAFGAMALLAYRRAGGTPGPAMLARIDRVARADRFDHGPWPGPRPLPSTLDELACVTNQDPALVAVNGAMFDRERTVRDRVGLAARWLEIGDEPDGYRERWTAHAEALVAGLASGAVSVEERADGRMALVTSRLPGSLRLGYARAPVVVAHDPGAPDADPPAPRRVVVAQYAPGHVDLSGVRGVLMRQERGWGGSSTILGSPQGRSCGLGVEAIVAVVAQHLLPGDSGPEKSESAP